MAKKSETTMMKSKPATMTSTNASKTTTVENTRKTPASMINKKPIGGGTVGRILRKTKK